MIDPKLKATARTLTGISVKQRAFAWARRLFCPFLLALAFARLQSAVAAPPNDTCAGALIVPGSGPFPHLTPLVDISTATLTDDPPVPQFYENLLSRSVWYRFTPSANALYTISTCSSASQSRVADTVMGLYTSAGGCAAYTQVAFEDENCLSQAEINAQLLAGTTYSVVVWKFDDGSPDDGQNFLQLRVNGHVPPSNERCDTATVILLDVPAFGTTAGAEDNYRIDAPGAFSGLGQMPSTGPGRDVVYRFIAPTNGAYSIKLWNADVTQDLLMYVASTCPSGTPATVFSALAAANRSRVNSSEEIFSVNLFAGIPVYIFVDHTAATDTGCSFILEVTQCVAEQEPNNTPQTASVLACGIEGSIGISGDLDFYSLGAFPANWRAFVLVDGESSRNSDLDVRIVSTNATIEFDGNNNDTLYGDSSPNISGAPLIGGPAYVLVSYNGPDEAQPYRVYAVVQPPLANAQLESEPNDTLPASNTGSLNYYLGALTGGTPATDVDVYRFNVAKGDLYFLSLDADPLRNNSPIDARLELLDTFGNALITANDAAFSSSTNQNPDSITGFGPFAPGEGIVYRFPEAGTFYARVSISPTAVGGTGAGDYLLSISRNCRSGTGQSNSAPAVFGLTLSSPGPEGRAMEMNGSVVDMDINDSFAATVFWGDGSSNTMSLATGGGLSLNLSHDYPPDWTSFTPAVSYPIVITARDNTGASTRVDLNAVVRNAAPEGVSLSLSTNTLAQYEAVTLSGSFFDPGIGDAHVVSINWGDGTPPQATNLPAGIGLFSAGHIYTIANRTVTVSVTVTDDDQGAGSATTNLTIKSSSSAARFVSIITAPGPSVHLSLQGAPSSTYRVERSALLGGWETLGFQSVGPTGMFEVRDANPGPSNRFYRAVLLQ